MKLKYCFLLFVMIICENVFSQIGDIYYDSLLVKPYVFSNNKIMFRLQAYDNNHFLIIIEKYSSNWYKVDSVWDYGKLTLDDINNDGFLDIVFKEKWNCEIHLFDPIKNNFINTGNFSSVEEDRMHLINKQLNIFYDWGEYKNWGWVSSLFQIKNYKRIELGTINNEKTRGQFSNETVAIVISQIGNKKKKNKKIVRKMKWDDDKEFNYAIYWKLNWKKFLRD